MTREEARADLMLAQSDIFYRPKDDSIDMAIEALENQKTGHWIDHEIKTVQWVECSECHITYKYKTHYCPNCGAKMEGE